MDYNRFINDKIRTVKPSGIRKYFDIANEMGHVFLSAWVSLIFRHLGIFVRLV